MSITYEWEMSLRADPEEEWAMDILIEVDVRLTNASYGGHFNHISGDGEPPSGPEWEMEGLRIAGVEIKNLPGAFEALEALSQPKGLDGLDDYIAERIEEDSRGD